MPSLTELFSPNEIVARVRRDVERSVLRTRNGIKHVAGIDRAKVGLSPKDTVWARHKVELWHYRRGAEQAITHGPPILLVMSLVSRSYVLDLRPGNSVVEYLIGEGFDVYMLDWGVPDEVESGNTLETYCDEYLPRAVDAVCADSGSPDVTMWGYCFGGLLSVLSVAGNPDMPVRNLLVMATPTDFQQMGPMSSMLQEGRIEPEAIIDETGNVPADVIRGSFKVLKPTADLSSYANLWENLWNDEFMEGYQAMTQWANDHIPFPGACFRQTAQLFNRQNALAEGEVRLGMRPVRLSAITVPFLNVVGEADHIVPPDAVGPLASLVGSSDVEELRLPAGHVGLVVGKGARRRTLPAMVSWVRRHSDPVEPAAPVAAGDTVG